MSIHPLIVTGPTATGKTRLAVNLARKYNGEIISADSRQVYKGLDLGTGKDLEEYGTPPDNIPAHLIDIVEPNQEFHLKKFLESAQAAIQDIMSRGKLPIIAGGTPLYVNALIRGYQLPGGEPDPELRKQLLEMDERQLLEKLHLIASPELIQRTDTTQKKRIARAIEIASSNEDDALNYPPLQNPLVIAPFFDRAEIHRRIELRLDERLQQGMIREVEMLHQHGVSWERLDWFGLEYRYIAKFLKNELELQEMRNQLLAKIRGFCKSQTIWFRKMEREGIDIHWIQDGDFNQAANLVKLWLNNKPLPKPTIRLADTHYGPKSKTISKQAVGRQSASQDRS